MCGRFTLRAPATEVAELFELDEAPDLQPRYNVAPTQPIAAVRRDPDRGRRELVLLRWGLVPAWADDLKIGYRTINARAETVATKPAFRRAFRKRRCLIVTDGFYEWRKTGGTKQPCLIHRKDDRPFAFAGLWERWEKGAAPIDSATIIVTEANALLKPIHDRMPVILAPEDYAAWLDSEIDDPKSLESLLRPCDPEEFEAYPVGTVVNNPRNETAECVKPAG